VASLTNPSGAAPGERVAHTPRLGVRSPSTQGVRPARARLVHESLVGLGYADPPPHLGGAGRDATRPVQEAAEFVVLKAQPDARRPALRLLRILEPREQARVLISCRVEARETGLPPAPGSTVRLAPTLKPDSTDISNGLRRRKRWPASSAKLRRRDSATYRTHHDISTDVRVGLVQGMTRTAPPRGWTSHKRTICRRLTRSERTPPNRSESASFRCMRSEEIMIKI